MFLEKELALIQMLAIINYHRNYTTGELGYATLEPH
jgi:hypothetical protein